MSAGLESGGLALIVRRRIAASPDVLFRAWTIADEFVRWWGPQGVVCESADIDLRLGGAYRIANRLPDGGLVIISGAFEAIEPPRRLVYTWRVDPGGSDVSRVTVSFNAEGDATDVCVAHEQIGAEEIRENHKQGWIGCLRGLADYAS